MTHSRVRRFLAASVVGGALLAAAVVPSSAAVAVPHPSLTQCIFEGRAMQNGRGNVFEAADRAFAQQDAQGDALFVATYNSWVPYCHLETKWVHELTTERSPAEAVYVLNLTD